MHSFHEIFRGFKSKLSAISCLAPEMGAKAALFMPDAVTAAYLYMRDGISITPPLPPADDAGYVRCLEVTCNELDSLVACPHSPAHVMPVATVGHVPLDQVYLGSCAGGRLEDFQDAASSRHRRAEGGLKRRAIQRALQHNLILILLNFLKKRN